MGKDQGYLERKCKNDVYNAYLREKWIGLHQTNTEMICSFYTYRQIHFTSENA